MDVEMGPRGSRAASTGDAVLDKLEELSERIARLEARDPKP